MSTYSSGINTADADLISCAAKSIDTLRLAEKIAKVNGVDKGKGVVNDNNPKVTNYVHTFSF